MHLKVLLWWFIEKSDIHVQYKKPVWDKAFSFNSFIKMYTIVCFPKFISANFAMTKNHAE